MHERGVTKTGLWTRRFPVYRRAKSGEGEASGHVSMVARLGMLQRSGWL